MIGSEYSAVDAQLLVEIRIALLRGKALPVSLLRVLAARGWVHAPDPSEVIAVRGAFEDAPETTVEAFSQELAVPNLTRSGRKEIRLHARRYDDDLLADLVGEDVELDEWDEEDEDGLY